MPASSRPLIVTQLHDPEAAAALAALDCDVVSVASPARLATAEYPRHPRLFVLETEPRHLAAAVETVRRLRGERPLTDVLLWAPQVRPAGVRELFLAGAKDVIVSRGAGRLAQSARDVLGEQQILPRLGDLGRQRSKSSRFESMLSRSAAMWDVFDLCSRVAPADATVLIVGETGTGKELLARAVHRRSQRKGRFVAANCASLPPELISSELFGHERGAFTGADRAKKGLVSHAHQGTLFLDEIGDMPPEAQQSLLRMLQERRIRPVGGLKEQDVDVRVVAATHVPLDDAVRAGEFREDLFYRLDVIRINVPPLRERPEDILFLFGHFSKKLSRHYGLEPPTFAESFLDAVVQHQWPGNVRQLENFAERMVLARPQRALTARDFARLRNSSLAERRGKSPVAESDPPSPETPPPPPPVDLSQTLESHLAPMIERCERQYLDAALRHNRGRIADTAEQAGISRRTLLRKMKRLQLDKRQYK